MKFVKVTALTAAMAASFGAIAGLSAMDDSDLESVTGQSGITIEQSFAGLKAYVLDADGATVGSTLEEGGTIDIELSTLSVDGASVDTSAGAIKMDIDVVRRTPGNASQNALRIEQQLTADTGTAYLKATLGVSGMADASTNTGDAAFAEALAATGNTIADIYVDMGSTTMYVYGH